MNENDKNKFLILGFLVGVIALFAFFTFSTKMLPVWIFIALIFAVQTFIIVPMICKYYYNVNDSYIGFSRFIPFYQNICIFSRVPAILICIVFALMLIAGIGLIPLDIFQTILGEYRVLQLSTISINAEIILILIYNIITGIGYFGVFRDVNLIHLQFTNTTKHSRFEVVNYILLFIPCIRCIALSMLLNRLTVLDKLNNYRIDEDEEIEELYESGE